MMKHTSRLAFASLLLFACGTEVVYVDGNGNPVEAPAANGAGAPVTPTLAPAKVSISEVAIYQAVKISLSADGARVAERGAPVLAGRKGLIRVFLTPTEGFAAGPIAGELTIRAKDGTTKVLKDTKSISKASTDASASSTLNFEVAAEDLTLGASYAVSVKDDNESSAAQIPVRYPAEASAFDDLSLQATGKVKVVVVPVRFDADSSQRLPDVTDEQLAQYKKTMMSLYPASDVEVTARAEPLVWTRTIAANGSGWSEILDAVTGLRRRDGADDETYYYGTFAPSSSFERYCRSGCVTGLSGLVSDASDAFMRASVGLGFTGEESANTMAHEIGHAHGREHAPCGGAGGPDRQFPYKQGGIGVWGYDINSKTFFSPTTGKDMMGYCEPAWISDYTYSALYDRIVSVEKVSTTMQNTFAAGGQSEPGGAFEMVTFDENGVAKTTQTIELARAPRGQVTQVEYLSGTNVIGRVTGHVYKYDHLAGGIVVYPKRALPADALRISGFGSKIDLKRALTQVH